MIKARPVAGDKRAGFNFSESFFLIYGGNI
ncbi:hypothetical protein MEC_00728 [Bartonella alsatica IBS 382]|uniref:Uncharacterized protein n=1 Tax=Bartonella alsatica IBS 382 TaxID=1094551 RepID=J1IUH7_9HYPH|nr:hypothetical protein MEC_00728 [Bartonella alsatica IBS 382]